MSRPNPATNLSSGVTALHNRVRDEVGGVRRRIREQRVDPRLVDHLGRFRFDRIAQELVDGDCVVARNLGQLLCQFRAALCPLVAQSVTKNR
jgi:hypothetical protein